MLTTYRHYILPSFLGGNVTGFISTGTFADDLKERSPTLRASLRRRTRALLFDNLVILHVLFISACTAGIILVFLRCFLPQEGIRNAYIETAWQRIMYLTDSPSTTPTTRDITVYLLTRVGWPPLIWYSTCVAMWTPIWYAIRPPTVMNQKDLLQLDEATGVLYPTAGAGKSRVSRQGRFKDHSTVVLSVYCVFTFFVSLFL